MRFYLLSGLQHGTGQRRPRECVSSSPTVTRGEPALRALLVALDEWVSTGIAPPRARCRGAPTSTAACGAAARVPDRHRAAGGAGLADDSRRHLQRGDHHAISARLRSEVRHEASSRTIRRRSPDVRPTRTSCRRWTRTATKSPASACRRSRRRSPPRPAGRLRRAGFGENDGCEAAGQYIPFKATRQNGWPRRSAAVARRAVQDQRGIRAGGHAAARQLEKRRLLLPEDVERYIAEAKASKVLQ